MYCENQDRDAVLRLLNRVGSGSSVRSRIRPSSRQQQQQQQQMYSYSPLPPQTPPQYEYTMEPGSYTSNQYVRVKAMMKPNQQASAAPLPVHLRSLIDVPKVNKNGRATSSGVRKLGLLRNNYRTREDDETCEKLLLSHNLLSTQMNG